MKKILNYINGEFVEAISKKELENINPATGQVYSTLPASHSQDVEQAVEAASRAFPGWSQHTPEQRADYLLKMSSIIEKRLDEFALAETIDNGKPIQLSQQLDIPRSVKNLSFFAEAIKSFHGETFRTDRHTINVTDYSPLGVVACISPWNLPLYLFTWKIAPALAAGNTVVAKPSEFTPMTAYLLCQAAQEAGLPNGVLNVVHGTGPDVGRPLVNHPKVKAVSFTGSTATGRMIAQDVAGQFKKVSLEMGGKNPNIIFADADFKRAVETTVRSSFLNQGQICLCGSRIFVEKSIYEEFKNQLVEKTKKLVVGSPLDRKTDQGALVSEIQMNKVLSYIQKAQADGGRFLTGGERVRLTGDNKDGYFIAPTLIEGLSFDSVVNQDEIFGPVATIMPFDNEDQVLTWANSTRYGLSATVWTQNLTRAQKFSKELESGIVWVNTWLNRDLRTPFGGVKESGFGREGGVEALKFFSEVKNTCTVTI